MSESSPKRLSVAEIQTIFDASPFISWLGLRALTVDYDKSEFSARMPLKPELERRPGNRQFHGGPIASFIDVVGDFAIGMLVGGGVPTMNLRIDYVRPAIGDALIGLGRTAAVIDIDVTDPEGRLVALGRGTYVSQAS